MVSAVGKVFANGGVRFIPAFAGDQWFFPALSVRRVGEKEKAGLVFDCRHNGTISGSAYYSWTQIDRSVGDAGNTSGATGFSKNVYGQKQSRKDNSGCGEEFFDTGGTFSLFYSWFLCF